MTKVVIPNLITPVVRNDGIAAQTMRAWMEGVTQALTVDAGEGIFIIDDGTAAADGISLFDDGGA